MTDTNLPATQADNAVQAAPAFAAIGFGGASGFDLAPKSLGEVVAFAKLMASARHAIPAHLRDNAGACMAVTIQALGWKMSPFAVAQKTYKVGDVIGYEAQIIAAVINARAGLAERPRIDFLGEGPTRQCRVTFKFRSGEERDYLSPMFKDIAVKNSPLWKSDTDQQLSYFSLRSAARRHCPEVILGVYDPDELTAVEPMPERPVQAERVSLRGKLASQTGQQGFDPKHVAAETAGHDATTGEVIEGEAAEVQTKTEAQVQPEEPAEARTETEAKDNLAAALASLDKKEPEQEAEVEAEAEHIGDATDMIETQAEPAAEVGQDGPDAIDGADDLIRQNAYDDGFAGDAIEPVLSMCENEAEEAIARAAYAEGQKNRITKEAEEHAAAEAAEAARLAAEAEAQADAPEIADKAGPAPKGEKYLLGSEEPGADGKLTLYQDGEVFSRIPAKAAAGKYTRYDGHPEPADPALKTQSGGTGLPETSTTEETPVQPAEAPKGAGTLYAELVAKDSWLQQKPIIGKLYQSDRFQKLSPAEQAQTRAHLFGAVKEMKERTKDPVDWAQDPAAFGLWMDWIAASDDADRADMIDGTFRVLQTSKAYTGRLTPEQQLGLEKRVQAAIAAIKGRA